MPLTKPTVRLVTYMKTPIPVLGCLHLNVTYYNHSAQTDFYIVRDGTSLLGMDLFTALRLQIGMDTSNHLLYQQQAKLLFTTLR